MAKIYETQEDVERERLTRVAKEARDAQTSVAAAITGVGLALLTFGFLKKKSPEIPVPKDVGFWKGVWEGFREGPSLKFLGGLGTILGGLEIFSSGKKAKHAEAELAKLGPEQIVSPHTSFKIEKKDSVQTSAEHVARLQNSVTANGKSL